MNFMNKNLFLKVANTFSLLWLLISSKLRKFLFTSFFILKSRGSKSANGLIRLFDLKNKLELVINEISIAYYKGMHPKHRLTNYYEFYR